jgi:hypothetical protein
MAYPNGWTQLTNIPEDAAALGIALTLVKESYPPHQYDHLTVRRLRRKMTCRENNNGDLVLGLRVFWRAGGSPNQQLDMTAFFFVRLRKSTAETYSVTFGVGAAAQQADISRELKAICEYMRTQPGGTTRLVMSETSPPATARPQLTAAFDAAVADGSLVYVEQIPADPPPWPNPYYVWRVAP